MNCQERQDLILLYATDGLSADERQELRAHLATGCPTCAGNLAEAQAALAAMPRALAPIAPSPAARQRLLDRVANSIQANQMPDSFPLRVFRILVPAAVAAGLAVIITHAVMTQSAISSKMRADVLETVLNGRDRQIQSLMGQLTSQQHVVEMLRSPDLKVVQLDGGKAQPAAIARLFWDQKNSTWMLLTHGVSAPPPGKTYELWYITADSKKVRAGIFNVDSTGQGTLTTAIPLNLGPLAVAAVTDEPIGGVDQPTGSIQLAAKLQ